MGVDIDNSRILVIEDEEDTLIFITNLLRREGFAPFAARNRDEGLAKAKAQNPGLIILDAMLPCEGSIQIYRELKKDSGLQHVPVVMLANIGKKTFFHFHKCRSSPSRRNVPEPEAFLPNPPEADDLLLVVRELTTKATIKEKD